MRFLFVFNPAAGKGRAVHDRPHIRAALERLQGTWRETRAAGDGVTIAAEAAGDVDAVVAVGGDGTMNEVVNGLMRIDVSKRPAFGLVLRPEIAALSMSGSSLLVAVNALLLKRLRLPQAEGEGSG